MVKISKRVSIHFGWWDKPFGRVQLVSRVWYYVGPITLSVKHKHGREAKVYKLGRLKVVFFGFEKGEKFYDKVDMPSRTAWFVGPVRFFWNKLK